MQITRVRGALGGHARPSLPTLRWLRALRQGATRRLAAWQYRGEKRDLRLDLLRGGAAAAMIIDHVGGQDSWLYPLSGGNHFFISAAEAFVFISGLVMGLVYAGLVARRGLRVALGKGIRRVATLYALTVGLSLLFAAVSFWFAWPWAPAWTGANVVDYVAGIVTLHRTYYLTDVLLLYTLVVAAALPALVLLARGKAWPVLAVSWTVWAAWQRWPEHLQLPWPVIDNGMFYFASWQVLFLTGLVLGYRAETWRRWAARLGRVRVPLQLGALVLTGLLVWAAASYHEWADAHGVKSLLTVPLDQLFGKPDLRAGRLALFACLFVCMFLLATCAWTPVRKLLGWLLLPLGRQALTVYTLHLFVIGLIVSAAPRLLGTSNFSAAENTLRQVAAIGLLWGMVQAKEHGPVLLGRAFRKARVWPAAWLGRGAARRPALPADGPRDRRARPLWGPARVAVGGLLFGAIALIAVDPGFAATLKTRSTTAVSGALVGAVPSAVVAYAVPAPAGAVPTALSASAIPAALAPAPLPVAVTAAPEPVLPDYVEKRTLHSESLGRDLPYYILLPPSYSSDPARRYPVLYMLHGASGTNTEWLYYGLLGRAMDMMRAGQIGEFLIVLPQGDAGYWMDQAGGGPRWGTYMARDVVGEIDARFRTLPDREHRAIGGLSMGGYGALALGILFPDVFSVVGADSPALHDQATAPAFFGDAGDFAARDPLALYPAHAAAARTLTLWLDVGAEDPWLPVVESFQQALASSGIPDAWHVFPGGHGGDYWSGHVVDYLEFYSAALAGARSTAPAAPVIPVVTSGTAL